MSFATLESGRIVFLHEIRRSKQGALKAVRVLVRVVEFDAEKCTAKANDACYPSEPSIQVDTSLLGPQRFKSFNLYNLIGDLEESATGRVLKARTVTDMGGLDLNLYIKALMKRREAIGEKIELEPLPHDVD